MTPAGPGRDSSAATTRAASNSERPIPAPHARSWLLASAARGADLVTAHLSLADVVIYDLEGRWHPLRQA